MQACTFVLSRLHSFRPDFLSIVRDVPELSCLVIARDFKVVPDMLKLFCTSFAVVKVGLCMLVEHFRRHRTLMKSQSPSVPGIRGLLPDCLSKITAQASGTSRRRHESCCSQVQADWVLIQILGRLEAPTSTPTSTLQLRLQHCETHSVSPLTIPQAWAAHLHRER